MANKLLFSLSCLILKLSKALVSTTSV